MQTYLLQVQPESHILNNTPIFARHEGVACDPTAVATTARWNPKTAYCIMSPDGRQSDEKIFGTVEKVGTDFTTDITAAFPQARVESVDGWYVTIFTDSALGKYQLGILDQSTQ